MPSVHLLIKGKVQGVFFRATAKDIAQALDVTGWIKNTRDGDVEAVATGSENGIHQFIEWCKIGPANAVVASINATSIEERLFEDFKIAR